MVDNMYTQYLVLVYEGSAVMRGLGCSNNAIEVSSTIDAAMRLRIDNIRVHTRKAETLLLNAIRNTRQPYMNAQQPFVYSHGVKQASSHFSHRHTTRKLCQPASPVFAHPSSPNDVPLFLSISDASEVQR